MPSLWNLAPARDQTPLAQNPKLSYRECDSKQNNEFMMTYNTYLAFETIQGTTIEI